MRADFTIVEGRLWHCGEIARKLRRPHSDVVAKVGLNSHRELRACFDDSFFRRAWLIDGQLAALGGVRGSLLEPDGFVWLAFTSLATRYPLEMVKGCRSQMAEVMALKRTLHTAILEEDQASRRLAIFLGFVPLDGGSCMSASSRFGRLDVLRRCEAESPARSFRNGAGILAMTYVPAQEAA